MKKKNTIFYIIVIVLICAICFFGYKIIKEIRYNNNNNSIKSQLVQNVYIKGEKPTITAGAKNWGDQSIGGVTNIYGPNDMQDNFIYADFNELRKNNEDIVGWIWIPDTQINYPIVQTTNNDYYLSRNFFKEYNEAGWIFADYRSIFSPEETNTVIYGHNRNDSSMFGDLLKLQDEKWFKNNENRFIYIVTENYTMVYEIISVYSVNTNPYYIGHYFNDDEFEQYLDYIMENNVIKGVSQNLKPTDRILTLSTCTNLYNKRFVVQAKLIRSKEIN